MKSANPESGAYHKYGTVDSDIVTYVNRYEIDNSKVKGLEGDTYPSSIAFSSFALEAP
jgi:hypothetical protein